MTAKRILTWDDFNKAVEVLADHLKPVERHYSIYGQPRGGLPLAVALSHRLGLPLVTEPTPYMIWVDDVYESGETLRQFVASHDLKHVIPVVWVKKAETLLSTHVYAAIDVPADEWVVFPHEVEAAADADAAQYSEVLYPVNDLYACVQGEGVHTGEAMILLRLHGCPVACPFCDTKETWEVDPQQKQPTLDSALGTNARYAELTAPQVVKEVQKVSRRIKWVLLTGGEPGLHRLEPLVKALQEAGYKVAIETSGTALGHIGAGIDWVCVSPKINMPGGLTVKPAALAVADEIKMVVGAERDIHRLEGLLSTTKLKEDVTICLQPISQSPKATELCITTVQQRGWRLSVQMHKYLNER